MDLETFEMLLKEAGLTKRELAKILNKSPQAIYNWGKNQDIPYWVESWLKNYIDLKKCKDELHNVTIEKDILKALSIKIFNRLYHKKLLSKVVYDSDLEQYIYFEFIHPYKDKIIDDISLETEAETKAKEAVAKAPHLDENVNQEIVAAFKEEILKELRKAKEEERIAKKLQEIEQKMQEIQKKLDEQEKKEG